MKLPLSLHFHDVNEYKEYFTSKTENEIEYSLRKVIANTNEINSFFDQTTFFTGGLFRNSFHLTKIFKMKLFESNPKYIVIGEIEKRNNGTIIKAHFKIKDQAKLFLAFALIPLALVIHGVYNSNSLILIIGLLSYLVLDLLFLVFLKLNIERCKKDFNRFL